MPERTARILVVDDDEAFRRTISRVLVTAGFEVVEASNLPSVMAALDEPPPVDLLLTDLRLAPGTPHGFSIGRLVQRRCPRIKIIFMTGGDPQGFALAEPDDIILRKPFRANLLLDTIRAALDSAPL